MFQQSHVGIKFRPEKHVTPQVHVVTQTFLHPHAITNIIQNGFKQLLLQKNIVKIAHLIFYLTPIFLLSENNKKIVEITIVKIEYWSSTKA